MLQPWDIFCWNQQVLISPGPTSQLNLRTRIFWWGGGITTTITMAITVLPRVNRMLAQGAVAAFLKGLGPWA